MQDVAEDGSGLVEGEVPDEHVRIVRDPVLEEVALGDRGETKLLVELAGETGVDLYGVDGSTKACLLYTSRCV